MTRAEGVAAFADFPERLTEAARSASARDRPVEAGAWGPAEIVRHLIAVEHEVWQARLATLLAAGDEPHWGWAEPGLAPGFDDASLEVILGAFSDARCTTVATVRDFDDDVWTRTGVHATYGRLDVAGLLRIATDHDADHLAGLGSR